MEVNDITEKIIGCSVKVHTALGPGLFEQVYKQCLVYELKLNSLETQAEVPIKITYGDELIECGYRADLLVENQVIVELKACEQVSKLHQRQLLTYLRLLDKQVGLLINFNSNYLSQGIHRIVHNYHGPKPQRPPPSPLFRESNP